MAGNYLIGLDIGGGGGRCLLVNAEDGKSTSVFRAWTLPPAPEIGGFAYKIDGDNVWRILGETVREALQQARISARDVAGIAATSMRHSTIVIDKKGNLLMAAPNRDARAAAQGMQLAIERGEELYQVTGHVPSPVLLASRLLWMQETTPDLFRKAAAAFSISDWIGYKLSGELASEYSQAGETLLIDLKTRNWGSDLLKSLGIPKKVLPALKQAGTKLGKLTKEAADNFGLPQGIPVAVAGADTQCGLLGSAVLADGQVGIIAGTTTPIQMVLDQPIIDPKMRLWTGLHLIPGKYVMESNGGQSGTTLEWVARLIHPDAPHPVAMLTAEAEGSFPGANGTHSTLGASVFNASAMEPPVDTMTFSSVVARPGDEGRADTARAVLEGMAYAVRANLEQIQLASGKTGGSISLSGGISRSALWTRIVSDVLNYPVQVNDSAEATALGAAICAGVGAGLFPDLETGADRLRGKAREILPGPDSPTYQTLYQDWMSLRAERRPADIVAINQVTDVMMSGLSAGESEGLAAISFRPKIYVSAEVDQRALKKLGELGEVTYKPYRGEGILLAGDDLVQTIKDYQVFVTEVDLVDADVILQLPELRLIVVCRGNPVNIDLSACSLASIPVTNTPGRNADAVADLTLCFMLMQARRMQGAAEFLRLPGGEAGDLGRMGQAHELFFGVELWQKTIGIIGGGAVGRKVMQRLLPFKARLMLFDPYLSDEQAALMGAEKVSLERLLEESDFISLHAAVTDSTRDMINTQAFERMKQGAFLINTARAALVDQQALLASLQNGKLGGYATDVFPVEPPAADDPLLAFPNVIATPHMGGNTHEVAAHQGEIIVSELELLLAGKCPKNILNPAAFDSFSWRRDRQVNEKQLRERISLPGPGTTDLEVSSQEMGSVDHDLEAKTINNSVGAAPYAEQTGKVDMMEINETGQKLVEILKEFTSAISTDQAMIKFAKGKNVVFLFTVKDLGQSFFLSFVDGQVSAGMQDPPREPDVRLKMAADILDGMFTGRVNATKAATSGKLSFSGDTGKAMSFIRIQTNMSKLYTLAREKVGDPGDLTLLAAEPAAQPAPSITADASQTLSSPAPVMLARTGDIRDQILLVNNELYAKNLITATGGNVSARCEDNPNQIWITPSSIFKGDLRADMMVRIDLEGNIVGETEYSASSERRVHCAIYKLRQDIEAVVHTHAPYATLMAITGTHFLPISTEAAFIGDVPVVPFIMPGTDELGEKVAEAIGSAGIAALMQNHGLVVAGSSLRRAADMSDVIEVTSHKILTCKMLGIDPAVLPEELVKTLLEVGTMMA